MAASIQCRSLGIVMEDDDDGLALFLDFRSEDKENSDIFRQNLKDFDDQLGSKPDGSLIPKITSAPPAQKTRADDFLNSENDKTSYDRLLMTPGAPLFPSLEMESKKIVISQSLISDGLAAVPKSRLANLHAEPDSRKDETSRPPVLSSAPNSSIAAKIRPLSSGGLTSTASRHATIGRATLSPTAKPSRPSTPTSRGTLSATAKPSRPSTPTSRGTLSATAKPSRSSTPTSRGTLSATAKPSRSSTPTSLARLPSTKTAAPPGRSSAPTRSMARSSTPTARSSVPAACKATSRSATPRSRPSTPSSVTIASGPAGRSSSVIKSGLMALKNSVPSRGASPTVKSRTGKPSETPGFSHDAPPNLKKSMPERPASASRGRPVAPGARPSSTETSSDGKPRRKACSPSRGCAPNGSVHKNSSTVLAMSRAHSTGSDDTSPVLIGTKMVERIVNMRKLAPPKQDDQITKNNYSPGKSLLSRENSGFGRTLSKASLDMALRHMGIRQSIPGNLHPLETNVPASSVCSVGSRSTKSRTLISVLDSPLATSSNASSETNVNNSSNCLGGSEAEDEQ